MRRAGIPLSRSTMNDLILLAADVCTPLWEAALAEVRADPHVQADETSCRTQTRSNRSFVWTFLSKMHIVYVFSPSRSGDTPNDLLGGTRGSLTVDGHTGYNVVTDIDGCDRSGCWCHARRHLFDALAGAPEAREGLDIILDLFLVERAAMRKQIVGTPEHLALRKKKSARVLERLRRWGNKTIPLFEPKSAMGKALRYMKNQWSRLTTTTEHRTAIDTASRTFSIRGVFIGRTSDLSA